MISYFTKNFTVKYEALKAENEATRAVDLEKQMKELKAKYKKLKVLFLCLQDFG